MQNKDGNTECLTQYVAAAQEEAAVATSASFNCVQWDEMLEDGTHLWGHPTPLDFVLCSVTGGRSSCRVKGGTRFLLSRQVTCCVDV